MSRLTSKDFRLVAKYHKNRRYSQKPDLYVDLTPRYDNSDLRYIMSVLSEDVLKELESRGFNLFTLRLQIDKTEQAIEEHIAFKEKRPEVEVQRTPLKRKLKEDRRLTNKDHRLILKYREVQNDCFADLSPRRSNATLNFIFGVFNKDVFKELKSRGFKLDSFEFRIDKTKEAIDEYNTGSDVQSRTYG